MTTADNIMELTNVRSEIVQYIIEAFLDPCTYFIPSSNRPTQYVEVRNNKGLRFHNYPLSETQQTRYIRISKQEVLLAIALLQHRGFRLYRYTNYRKNIVFGFYTPFWQKAKEVTTIYDSEWNDYFNKNLQV